MRRQRDIILVLLITFLYHTMNQMFVPTLPLYISDLGGSEVVVGVLVSLVSFGSIFGKMYLGRVATQHSNLFVLRIGLVIATVVLFFYLPFWGFAFLAIVRFLQSIGLAGFVTGAQGLLSDFTRPENRGFFFGVFSAMIGLGMMVGPLLGNYLAENFGYPTLFWGTALVVGLAAILSFVLDEKDIKGQGGMGRSYRPHPPWKNKELVVICGAIFFAATINGSTMSMLSLHARHIGLGTTAIFFFLFALLFTVGGSFAGYLSDRFGRLALIIPGFLFLITGTLLLAFLQDVKILVVSGICAGIGLGVLNTVLISMVPTYSKNAADAVNDLAFFSNAFDSGIVLGSFGLSWLAAYSFSAFWLAIAILMSLGLVLFIKYNPEKSNLELELNQSEACS